MSFYPLFFVASMQPAWEFFQKGGPFMYLLLGCSVVSVSVILVRALALRRSVVMPRFIEREVESIQPGEVGAAVAHLARVVEGDRSTLGRIIGVGLRHLSWPKAENTQAVETRAQEEVVRLESGLFVLEIIVGIAPLLGLLGAVSGLVTVFAAFGSDTHSQDPRGIANGISEALSTTIVGLAIAIPSLIAYSYFSRKIETMAVQMASLTAELLAKCYHQRLAGRGGERMGMVETQSERESSHYASGPNRVVVPPVLGGRPAVEDLE